MAIGKCLRIKVKWELAKPLMRGTMVEVYEKGRKLWCPIEYEFLPDFYFICGIIGHVDKECDRKLSKGEEPQYGKWLKWIPLKKPSSFDGGRRAGTDRGGRRSYFLGSKGSKSGSDADTWRKDLSGGINSKVGGAEERGAKNILKITSGDDIQQKGGVYNEKFKLQVGEMGSSTNSQAVGDGLVLEKGKEDGIAMMIDEGSMRIDRV
jgi:hypothetical protein